MVHPSLFLFLLVIILFLSLSLLLLGHLHFHVLLVHTVKRVWPIFVQKEDTHLSLDLYLLFVKGNALPVITVSRDLTVQLNMFVEIALYTALEGAMSRNE